jgi:capsular polysaccharide transport system ATP-binding protein
MIELRNVTKSYPAKVGRRYVLRDASIVLPVDKNVALLGPNGAGKSTFLRLISGAEPADSGSIITNCKVSWPLGVSSGFQSSLTGRQNVAFVCNINGLTNEQTRSVVEQVTEFAELGDYFDMPIKTYSSGMRARLGFGLSMSFKFDVYVVDELTSVGDATFRKKAKFAFEEFRQRAKLIFASHNMETLRETCESVIFIRNGLIDYYEDVEEGIRAYSHFISPGVENIFDEPDQLRTDDDFKVLIEPANKAVKKIKNHKARRH